LKIQYQELILSSCGHGYEEHQEVVYTCGYKIIKNYKRVVFRKLMTLGSCFECFIVQGCLDVSMQFKAYDM
jgi:hypothetical protein